MADEDMADEDMADEDMADGGQGFPLTRASVRLVACIRRLSQDAP